MIKCDTPFGEIISRRKYSYFLRHFLTFYQAVSKERDRKDQSTIQKDCSHKFSRKSLLIEHINLLVLNQYLNTIK